MRIATFLNRHLASNRKIRDQLIIVYVIGVILPVLIMNTLAAKKLERAFVNQEIEQQRQEVTLMAGSLRQPMQQARLLSDRLGDGETIRSALMDNSEILFDYKQIYALYLNEISFYTYDEALSRNTGCQIIDGNTRTQEWYIEAMYADGEGVWSYEYEETYKACNLVFSRVLYDADHEPLGVLKLVLYRSDFGYKIMKTDAQMVMMYKNCMPLYFNSTEHFTEISNFLSGERTHSGNAKLLMDGVVYSACFEQINVLGDTNFTLVSLIPQKLINAEVFMLSLPFIIISMVGVILGFILILYLGSSLSSRLRAFHNEMHKVATGDFDIQEPAGIDEIEGFYDDLKLVVDSLQELSDKLLQEGVQKEKINTRQREVEFKMLASQINPHFLFNTLETIRMKALVQGQGEIAELTKMLAKLMRNNIQAGEKLQTVGDEVQLIAYYLKIQDCRFHDRIHYEIDVKNPERVNGLEMMPLVIQPFVENAFVHGLEAREKDGKLKITVWADSWLWISIEDNGCGMSISQLEDVRFRLNDFENLDKEHIGICNVNQRIKLRYGEEYGVTIDSTPLEGTKVMIKLPVNGDWESYIQ